MNILRDKFSKNVIGVSLFNKVCLSYKVHLANFDDLKNIIRDFLIAYYILPMTTRCFWSFNWTIALQIDLNDVN